MRFAAQVTGRVRNGSDQIDGSGSMFIHRIPSSMQSSTPIAGVGVESGWEPNMSDSRVGGRASAPAAVVYLANRNGGTAAGA